MGLEKIEFGWYLRKITLLALAGYFAGMLVYFPRTFAAGLKSITTKKGLSNKFQTALFYLYCLFESFSEYAILKGLKKLVGQPFLPFSFRCFRDKIPHQRTLDMNFSRSTT